MFGERGYDIAVKGTNGIVCLIELAWDHMFKSYQFWYPKMRALECLNPAVTHSVLAQYLMRTK